MREKLYTFYNTKWDYNSKSTQNYKKNTKIPPKPHICPEFTSCCQLLPRHSAWSPPGSVSGSFAWSSQSTRTRWWRGWGSCRCRRSCRTRPDRPARSGRPRRGRRGESRRRDLSGQRGGKNREGGELSIPNNWETIIREICWNVNFCDSPSELGTCGFFLGYQKPVLKTP